MTDGLSKDERREFNDANRPHGQRVEVVPSSPTSEPIPASDQLREPLPSLLDDLIEKAREYQDSTVYATPSHRKTMREKLSKSRAAVEELFSAQLGEIERLRAYNIQFMGEIAEARHELASLRVDKGNTT